MASTPLATPGATIADSLTHGRNLVVVSGGRLYAVYNDGTNVVYQWSDNNGLTWSSKVNVWTSDANRHPTAFYDWTRDRLNIVSAGGNAVAEPLYMRAITSNVTSGTPGALTTNTVIDPAGDANSGVYRPYAFISDTGTRPRYWIIAAKRTGASAYETRAWYANAGTDADTAGNWTNTNFTNLGGNSDSNTAKAGVGGWWTISGNDRVTFVFSEGSADTTLETCTFDPTVAAPIPAPTMDTVDGSSEHQPSLVTEGVLLACIAAPDYFIVTCFELTTGDVNIFKTEDGATWTQPNAGWVDEVMGRHALASNFSTKIWLVYMTAYNALAGFDENIQYRELDMATDTWSAGVAFSDTQGNGVAVVEDAIYNKLNVIYRAGTASPYPIRSDYVAVDQQTILPDADLAAGGWTTSPLYSKLNDTSDSTLITATSA